ncbi:MAG: ERF family protein [Bacteroidales bacterium]|nr:ERF family protein [Bacteroidales bacterium]
MEAKNVYQKLQSTRVQLLELKLPKSGENKFSHYFYFELSDFLPSVQKIFEKVGLTGITSFTPETASLAIINNEKPDESVTFTSPMAGVDLKGMHAIQNMGAVETYQRRYLYMMALEITEPDDLEPKPKQDEKPIPVTVPQPKPEKKTTDKIPIPENLWVKAIERMNAKEKGVPDKLRKAFILTPEQEETLKHYEA